MTRNAAHIMRAIGVALSISSGAAGFGTFINGRWTWWSLVWAVSWGGIALVASSRPAPQPESDEKT